VDAPHILLIDIDGLRPDVFSAALGERRIPNLARLLGGPKIERGVQIPVVAPAPSITFTSQASLFTGQHPTRHGIPGNQFFDRFGTRSEGVPRHYAFDVGDTLAADDAVLVFSQGLASQCLQVPTLYAQFAQRGRHSVVAGNMYARGADVWLKPSLVNLARFTKGGNLFGLTSEEFDRFTLDQVLDYLAAEGLPEILTVYFMGVDHESHHHGPDAQLTHLAEGIDPMIGELWGSVSALDPAGPWLVAIFSDHGQIAVPADDRHSLRMAFPFEREMAYLFDALGLDVHDFPGEDPNCDAVVAANGGLAHVYLQNRRTRWADTPEFDRDVLPVAKAFWEAHASGKYAPDLEGALAGVLLRNVEKGGWQAGYQALTPQGQIVSLETWFSRVTDQEYTDPVWRIEHLTGPLTGDLLLISNYAGGFYFGGAMPGVHGGLHPDDSLATLAYGFPRAEPSEAKELSKVVEAAIQRRCQAEGGRLPSTADLLTGLLAVVE
jgi:hypothetical protein